MKLDCSFKAGRVTPCAPLLPGDLDSGAHGVTRPANVGGYMIIECLVYCVVLLILLAVAYSAFYRCTANSVALRRNTDDIASALQAGERWRADVRAATSEIRSESLGDETVLHLPTARGEIVYTFTTNAVLRGFGGNPGTCLLPSVAASVMQPETRDGVTAWRWELALKPRSKKPVRVQPLFTFLAVPGNISAK